MTDYLATLALAVRSIDPKVAGSCLLGFDLMLFGILAMFWEEAGHRKLLSRRRKQPPETRILTWVANDRHRRERARAAAITRQHTMLSWDCAAGCDAQRRRSV